MHKIRTCQSVGRIEDRPPKITFARYINADKFNTVKKLEYSVQVLTTVTTPAGITKAYIKPSSLGSQQRTF